MKNEIKRLISPIIKNKLKLFGAITIEGPKWCGKTYQGILYSNSQYFMNEDIEKNKALIDYEWKNNPIFNGNYPRLIDEWQILPTAWDKIRFIIDMNLNKPGQFILIGSNSINWNEVKHSGAGRISIIKMSTLTFYEISRTKIDEFISIKELFENLSNFKLISTSFDVDWISKNILIGGWPSIYSKSINENEKTSIANDHVNNILNSKVEHINLNINKNIFREILKSIARLNGSQLNYSTILKDIKNQISLITLQKYIELLESLYLIDYLNSWSTNVRSKTTIRNKLKMYFCDPSIGLSVLKIKNSKYLIEDPRLFGIYFENQVIKDLKVFCQNIGAELYFYRDRNDFEINAIIQLDDGRLAPIEIKLSNSNQEAIDNSAKRLLSLENKIKTDIGTKLNHHFIWLLLDIKEKMVF